MVNFGSSKSQPATVWNQQAPYLQALYGLGLGMTQSQLGMGGQPNQQNFQGSTPQPGGPQANGFFLPGVGGGGIFHTPGPPQQSPGANPTPFNSLYQPGNPEFNILAQRATGGSPWLQQQIQGLGQNIGNFYNQQVLPGINQDASFYGGTGGARQGIAQGLAGQSALQQFQQGATGLYQNDYNQGLTAALNLGQSQWQPLAGLASLLGGPAMLGGGSHSFNAGLLNFFGGGSGGTTSGGSGSGSGFG